jgi:hypothetical protein
MIDIEHRRPPAIAAALSALAEGLVGGDATPEELLKQSTV